MKKKSAFDSCKTIFATWALPVIESAAEVFIVTLIGVAPFLLAVLRHNAMNNSSASGFDITSVFEASFSGGQLYLYAFSMLGTLLWLSVFKWTVPLRLYRWILAFIVLIVGFIIVALGGIDPTFSRINNQTIVGLSYYCYALFIAVYFFLLLGEKERPPTARSTFHKDTEVLIEKLDNLDNTNADQ